MPNGSNDWGTQFSDIKWLEKLLRQHDNISAVDRSNDIVFEITRLRQQDTLRILCLRKYVMSITLVLDAIEQFGDLDIIYIGGGWNGYTQEAKDYCLSNGIGLYVTNEMTGAIHKNDFWNYHRRDEDGNPCFYYKSE